MKQRVLLLFFFMTLAIALFDITQFGAIPNTDTV